MKKTIVFTIFIVALLVIPIISANELTSVPKGILDKFDNFKDCFGSAEERCHQFDYDKNGIVGLADFGKFIQKYTKMTK